MDATRSNLDSATSLSMFDIIPFPALIVDEDIRIFQYNPAALSFFKSTHGEIVQHLTGDVLHCLHSSDNSPGCGKGSFCNNCVIRSSVADAFGGKQVARRRTKLEIKLDGKTERLYLLITALPLPYSAIPLALLLIEDVKEIAELQRLIPLCSKCKKVRDEKRAWIALESYFKTMWDVDFSHGYCPECLKEELDLLRGPDLCEPEIAAGKAK